MRWRDIPTADTDSTYYTYVTYCSGYYKCSTVRGCPARKHVERDPGEPAMLIVTYDGDHRHGEPGHRRPDEAATTTEHRTTDQTTGRLL